MDENAERYRRFLNGDERAFYELIEALRDGLTFFVNRYLHDLPAAEDVAADSFVYLRLHPRRYNFKVGFKTYLYMIGRSRALDQLRRRALRREVSAEVLGEAADAAADPEAAYLRDETRRRLRAAVDALPREMRAAVWLVYYEELSYDEAARVLKKNRKQIDNLLYRAKQRLKAVMEEE